MIQYFKIQYGEDIRKAQGSAGVTAPGGMNCAYDPGSYFASTFVEST